MSLLLLNRRPLLDQVPSWLSGESLVVVTAASCLSAADSRESLGFRRLEVVTDYEAESVSDLIDELCSEEDVTRILSTAEFDVLRAAGARERHGLPGQRMASASAYRDKHRMTALAAEGGVRTARGVVVQDHEELRAFADEVGFPLVVKPVDGAGSVGVRLASSARELAECALPTGRTWRAEEFVSGGVCHVDGLMLDGEVLHAIPSAYLHSNLDTVRRSAPSMSVMLSDGDSLAASLLRAVQDTVAVLPPVPVVTAFHAEFFDAGTRPPVLCEIACRPGGCGIVEAYELATGVNLYAAQLRGQAGLPVTGLNVGVQRHGWSWFPPRHGTVRHLPATCPLPGTHRYTTFAAPGEQTTAPGSSTDRVAELVFRVDHDADSAQVLTRLDRWWAEAASWDQR